MAVIWHDSKRQGVVDIRKGKPWMTVSGTRNGGNPVHILVIGLSLEAMQEMRLQVGDRVQLGFDDADTGRILLRRTQTGGATLTARSGHGSTKQYLGQCYPSIVKFGGAPFGLPFYQYTPLTRKDVDFVVDVLSIPVLYLTQKHAPAEEQLCSGGVR